MRLLIDAASAKIGGAISYLKGLLPLLERDTSGNEWLVLVRPETAEALEVQARGVTLVYTSDEGGLLNRFWWRQVVLRRLIKALKVDALFSSANFAMFWCPVRQVVLVRNAAYFDDRYVRLCVSRHPLRRKLEYWMRRWLIHAGVRRSDVVMTPTQALMDDVCRRVKPKRSARLIANPYGVRASQEQLSRDFIGPITRLSDLPVKLLYVSLYADYKNLSTLLKSLPVLNRAGGSQTFFLTTTVNPAPKPSSGADHEPDASASRKEDLTLASRPDVKPWVRFVGPLSPRETLQLYGSCDIFVFPSYCESFGHPLVEAMAHGLPVVAADTPGNREMCQDAGVYFDPLDPSDLASQVRRVTENTFLRVAMRVAAQRRVRECFTWGKHLERLTECLRPAGSRARTVDHATPTEPESPVLAASRNA